MYSVLETQKRFLKARRVSLKKVGFFLISQKEYIGKQVLLRNKLKTNVSNVLLMERQHAT